MFNILVEFVINLINLLSYRFTGTHFITNRKFSSETKENLTNESQSTESINSKNVVAEIESLTNQIKSLNEKNEELLDKYKRSLADSENLRKRLSKQIDDAKLFGIQKFCKDLLDVADTLGHATIAVPKEEISAKNPHLKNLYEGLTMTQSSLLKVFKNHGLEIINPINEKFNPNLHEALFQIVSSNKLYFFINVYCTYIPFIYYYFRKRKILNRIQ